MSQKKAKRLRQAQRKATGSCELDRKREATSARCDARADARYERQRTITRRLLEIQEGIRARDLASLVAPGVIVVRGDK